MSELVKESALTDSSIYQALNKNGQINSLLVKAIKRSERITPTYVEEQLMQIDRTRISPLCDEVVDAFKDGDIILYYAKDMKIVQALPFIVMRMQGRPKAVIFTNNYGTISKADKVTDKKYLNITMKDLYVLLEGAYVALQNARYPDKIKRSLGLMKLCGNIYTNMIMRVLNKDHAVSMDLELAPKVEFAIGYFFHKKVWMSNNNDIAFSYAKSNIRDTSNVSELLITQRLYDNSNIETMEDLIKFISEMSPRMAGANFRYFLERFINTYKPAAILGLECLPYFLFVVQSSLIGSFIVNQPIITDITKNIKGMNNFYPELTKSIM